jgi:hypothetical protein
VQYCAFRRRRVKPLLTNFRNECVAPSENLRQVRLPGSYRGSLCRIREQQPRSRLGTDNKFMGPVVRQTFTRDQNAAVLSGVGVNTTIDSIQQEDSGGGRACVRVERTYI